MDSLTEQEIEKLASSETIDGTVLISIVPKLKDILKQYEAYAQVIGESEMNALLDEAKESMLDLEKMNSRN